MLTITKMGPDPNTHEQNQDAGVTALVPASSRLVDIELVALRILHPHRIVIEAVGAQGSGDRGPEIRQPPGLGVDSLRAGGERDVPVHHRTAAAGVNVEVEAV